MQKMFCRHLGVCGGCPWGERPLENQREDKLSGVRAHFAGVQFAETPTLGLRDRVDLVWDQGKLGLYSRETREILALEECPMLSPALFGFFERYRQTPPPGVRRGSVRLRVSPAGERGVWLDLANIDVKNLFGERAYLAELSTYAFVEIGQRRKALTFVNGEPKLTDPVLKPWFESYGPGGEAIPLFGPVGGFTQSGFKGNRALVGAVAEAVAHSGVTEWTELFSGNGNFSLALASRGLDVTAIELDPLATEGFTLAAQAHPEWRLKIERGDVYRRTKELPATRGLLVDPPRSGLREVLTALEQSATHPEALIYVSCFTETFSADAEKLRALGYQLRSLVGVDQFAHSPHAEWVARFEKI